MHAKIIAESNFAKIYLDYEMAEIQAKLNWKKKKKNKVHPSK